MLTVCKIMAISGMILCSYVYAENLVRDEYFKQRISYFTPAAAYHPARGDFDVKDEVLRISSRNNGETSFVGIRLPIEYSTAERLELTFSYKLKGRSRVGINFNHPDPDKRLGSFTQTIPQASDWRIFKADVPLSPMAMGAILRFETASPDAEIFIRDLCVKEIEPSEPGEGHDILLNGEKCRAIFWMESDIANSHYDRKAAQILRFALARSGCRLIPVRKVNSAQECLEPGIYIGKAARLTGIIDEHDISKIREGGYYARLDGGRLAIAGHDAPYSVKGATLGAVELLHRMGIKYYSNDFFTQPKENFFKLETYSELGNPAVPFRWQEWQVKRHELFGHTSQEALYEFPMIAWLTHASHWMTRIISLREFQDSKPEFFALQKDGARLRLGKHITSFHAAHYCYSNRELVDLTASRYIELIKASPLKAVFEIYPGDFLGFQCVCPDCEKLGPTYSDRYFAFVNKVTEIIRREYPGIRLKATAYFETSSPPLEVRPDKNLFLNYCTTWPSRLWIESPANDESRRVMASWEKLFPGRMMGTHYPRMYSEMQNVWPAHRALLELSKYCAVNGYFGSGGCYMVPPYGAIYGSNAFGELTIHAANRILIDPTTDVDLLEDEFIASYYGPAAVPMKKYFDIITTEPQRRQWVQADYLRRGFVTKELAEKCLPLLDEAEKLAGQTRYRRHVLREKYPFLWSYCTDICRGNAGVTRDNFSEYAKRLAEFCSIARENKYSCRTLKAPDWLWQTALYKIGDDKSGMWFDDPKVSALIADPEGALGATLPNSQEKTSYGYLVMPDGIIGGQSNVSTWFRTKGTLAKCMRRPLSGFGTAQFLLRLDSEPAGKTRMVVNGIDNEKESRAQVEILVNGKAIFRGDAPWEKRAWGEREFDIPAGVLVAGDNEIVIRNITRELDETKTDEAFFLDGEARHDFFWGWFMFDTVKFIIEK